VSSERADGDVSRGTSTASYLVWGHVPLIGIATTVIVLERRALANGQP
jgi:hypothetical protein